MKTFKINGKRYEAKEIDFNFLCDLEDAGVSLADLEKKPMSTARAYFAVCFGGDVDKAGKELEAHMTNGGNLNALMNAFADALQHSDFFRAISQGAQTENTEDQE